MTLAFVGLGSNLSDPAGQLDQAVQSLETLPGTKVVAVSPYYQSAPFGPVRQPDFVNAAAMLRTSLAAMALLRHLKEIEVAQGRVRGRRWGPRIIDLDLLLHGSNVASSRKLILPHPGIAERNFVLLPLRDVAPDLVVPGVGRIADIEINMDEPRIARLD